MNAVLKYPGAKWRIEGVNNNPVYRGIADELLNFRVDVINRIMIGGKII